MPQRTPNLNTVEKLPQRIIYDKTVDAQSATENHFIPSNVSFWKKPQHSDE